ncbi:hypothetical protein KIPB_002591, partial [Kipferlia bialata]
YPAAFRRAYLLDSDIDADFLSDVIAELDTVRTEWPACLAAVMDTHPLLSFLPVSKALLVMDSALHYRAQCDRNQSVLEPVLDIVSLMRCISDTPLEVEPDTLRRVRGSLDKYFRRHTPNVMHIQELVTAHQGLSAFTPVLPPKPLCETDIYSVAAYEARSPQLERSLRPDNMLPIEIPEEEVPAEALPPINEDSEEERERQMELERVQRHRSKMLRAAKAKQIETGITEGERERERERERRSRGDTDLPIQWDLLLGMHKVSECLCEIGHLLAGIQATGLVTVTKFPPSSACIPHTVGKFMRRSLMQFATDLGGPGAQQLFVRLPPGIAGTQDPLSQTEAMPYTHQDALTYTLHLVFGYRPRSSQLYWCGPHTTTADLRRVFQSVAHTNRRVLLLRPDYLSHRLVREIERLQRALLRRPLAGSSDNTAVNPDLVSVLPDTTLSLRGKLCYVVGSTSQSLSGVLELLNHPEVVPDLAKMEVQLKQLGKARPNILSPSITTEIVAGAPGSGKTHHVLMRSALLRLGSACRRRLIFDESYNSCVALGLCSELNQASFSPAAPKNKQNIGLHMDLSLFADPTAVHHVLTNLLLTGSVTDDTGLYTFSPCLRVGCKMHLFLELPALGSLSDRTLCSVDPVKTNPALVPQSLVPNYHLFHVLRTPQQVIANRGKKPKKAKKRKGKKGEAKEPDVDMTPEAYLDTLLPVSHFLLGSTAAKYKAKPQSYVSIHRVGVHAGDRDADSEAIGTSYSPISQWSRICFVVVATCHQLVQTKSFKQSVKKSAHAAEKHMQQIKNEMGPQVQGGRVSDDVVKAGLDLLSRLSVECGRGLSLTEIDTFIRILGHTFFRIINTVDIYHIRGLFDALVRVSTVLTVDTFKNRVALIKGERLSPVTGKAADGEGETGTERERETEPLLEDVNMRLVFLPHPNPMSAKVKLQAVMVLPSTRTDTSILEECKMSRYCIEQDPSMEASGIFTFGQKKFRSVPLYRLGGDPEQDYRMMIKLLAALLSANDTHPVAKSRASKSESEDREREIAQRLEVEKIIRRHGYNVTPAILQRFIDAINLRGAQVPVLSMGEPGVGKGSMYQILLAELLRPVTHSDIIQPSSRLSVSLARVAIPAVMDSEAALVDIPVDLYRAPRLNGRVFEIRLPLLYTSDMRPAAFRVSIGSNTYAPK